MVIAAVAPLTACAAARQVLSRVNRPLPPYFDRLIDLRGYAPVTAAVTPLAAYALLRVTRSVEVKERFDFRRSRSTYAAYGLVMVIATVAPLAACAAARQVLSRVKRPFPPYFGRLIDLHGYAPVTAIAAVTPARGLRAAACDEVGRVKERFELRRSRSTYAAYGLVMVIAAVAPLAACALLGATRSVE